MSGTDTILVIDDDASLRYILLLNLQAAGYQVVTAADGATGLAMAKSVQPDLVIVDVMMPAPDGFNVCRTLREERGYPDCSILMLTARGEVEDKGAAFDAGADDYVVKPFDPREVVWRCQALLRRVRRPHLSDQLIRCGALILHPSTLTVELPDRRVVLPRLEFLILMTLAESADHVVPTETLLKRIWQQATDETMANLRVQIARLRQHVEPNPADPQYVRTVRGQGYLLAAS